MPELYMNMEGVAMWIPLDPRNPDRQRVELGLLMRCDAATGAPLLGERERVEHVIASWPE